MWAFPSVEYCMINTEFAEISIIPVQLILILKFGINRWKSNLNLWIHVWGSKVKYWICTIVNLIYLRFNSVISFAVSDISCVFFMNNFIFGFIFAGIIFVPWYKWDIGPIFPHSRAKINPSLLIFRGQSSPPIKKWPA